MITSISELRKQLNIFREKSETIGLVPTMGNLHQGHLNLVMEANNHANRVIVSIFVNPMQFGPHEDFDAYPRTIEADRRALVGLGCDVVFAPTVREIYPKGVNTEIDVPSLSNILCGLHRPGHFKGVATVVAKLLNIVQPDIAVFGNKDYQQLQIIKAMVSDLLIPVEIIGAETARESSGLAMSSRNSYLEIDELPIAALIHQCLSDIAAVLKSGSDVGRAIKMARQTLSSAGFAIDYLEIHDAADLCQSYFEAKYAVILIAAKLGKARLIDNIVVSLSN